MTDEQYQSILLAIKYLQDKMFLKHFLFFVKKELSIDDSGIRATVYLHTKGGTKATIRIYEKFFSDSLECQAQHLIHEMVHCVLHKLAPLAEAEDLEHFIPSVSMGIRRFLAEGASEDVCDHFAGVLFQFIGQDLVSILDTGTIKKDAN